jgi:hypothetical protein
LKGGALLLLLLLLLGRLLRGKGKSGLTVGQQVPQVHHGGERVGVAAVPVLPVLELP